MGASRELAELGSVVTVSSGNVGIGTSSPDSLSNFRFLDVGSSGTNQGVVQANNGTVKVAVYANGTEGLLATRTNHNLSFQTNGSTRATIDSVGNVGIGGAPSADTTYKWLNIYGPSTSGGGMVEVSTSDRAVALQMFCNNLAGYIGTANSHPLLFRTNSIERARIDTGGNLLIGATNRSNLERVNVTHDGASQEGVIIVNTNTSAGTHTAIGFRRPSATTVGNITTTLSSTAYVTSSDYRLKENVQPMTGALAKVAALKPCTYTWKVDGSTGEGFIAHELAEVVPDAVTGEKDAVNEDGSIKPQGIDTSFLVATLAAAIQELNAKVEAQAAEIAALKGAA